MLYAMIEFANLFMKNDFLIKFNLVLIFLVILFSVGSVLTGNLSFQELLNNPHITNYHIYVIEQHEYFATLTLWYFIGLAILNFYIKVKNKNAGILPYIFIIFVVLGFYLIVKTAYIGGGLVYNYGIGTNLLK